MYFLYIYNMYLSLWLVVPLFHRHHIDYAFSHFGNTRPCTDLPVCSNYITVWVIEWITLSWVLIFSF